MTRKEPHLQHAAMLPAQAGDTKAAPTWKQGSGVSLVRTYELREVRQHEVLFKFGGLEGSLLGSSSVSHFPTPVH